MWTGIPQSFANIGLLASFDAKGKAQEMLHFDSPVDSIAFGMDGSRLSGLLFVSNNNGQLDMVDLATLQHVINVPQKAKYLEFTLKDTTLGSDSAAE